MDGGERVCAQNKSVYVLAQTLPVVAFFRLKESFPSVPPPLSTPAHCPWRPVFCYPNSTSNSSSAPITGTGPNSGLILGGADFY